MSGGPTQLGKYHGAGNDFLVVVDEDDARPLVPAEVVALCDRHRGVGADGVLRVSRGTETDLRMELRNADGSAAEMSGNGIRCLVQAAVEGALVAPGEVTVATAAGTRRVVYRELAAGLGAASVEMGTPEVLGTATVGELLDGLPATAAEGARTVAGVLPRSKVVWEVDLGNPHLVLLVESAEQASLVQIVGSVLERSGRHGANVELAWPSSEGGLAMRVWERGVGETLACGTGSVAVAAAWAAARRSGGPGPRPHGSVAVQNPGGVLRVTLGEQGAVLEGPTVAVGRVELAEGWLGHEVATGTGTAAAGPGHGGAQRP